MADDLRSKKNKKGATPRGKLTEAEAIATLERLATCTTTLTPEQVQDLDDVFPYIIETHRGRVQNVFRGLPPEDIDDLSQTTFSRAHERLCAHGFKDDVDVVLEWRAYSLRHSYFRTKRRNRADAPLPSSTEERPRSLGADQRDADALATYQRFRASLSAGKLELLELAIEEGRSRREIARLLKRPLATVQKQIIALRKALRSALGEVAPEAREGAAEKDEEEKDDEKGGDE